MLEAMQLFMECLQEIANIQLLRAFYQHILFNFCIWSRCSFNVQIGNILLYNSNNKFYNFKNTYF